MTSLEKAISLEAAAAANDKTKARPSPLQMSVKQSGSAGGDARQSGVIARRAAKRRQGALLSMEFIYICPIVIAVFFAISEFGLLWSANQRLKAASFVAAREAAMPALMDADRIDAAEAAAEEILEKEVLVVVAPDMVVSDTECVMTVTLGDASGDPVFTGDPVCVEIRMPMTLASPDLLKVVGISIEDRFLTAKTTMRIE